MKELKVTIAETVYTAPAPRVKEFKEYLKLMRERERAKTAKNNEDISAEFAFIASLFRDPAVTPDALDEADLAEGIRLQNDYIGWMNQYIPDTGKNAKAR